MRKVVFLLFLIIFIPTIAYGQPYKSEPTGFNDIPWGTNIEEVKDLFYFVQEWNGINYYKKINEDYSIPDIKILQVDYGFRDGKFACVNIRYSNDIDSFIYMMDSLYHNYGPGSPVRRGHDGLYSLAEIAWFGDKTTIFLNKYNPETSGRVFFTSSEFNKKK